MKPLFYIIVSCYAVTHNTNGNNTVFPNREDLPRDETRCEI